MIEERNSAITLLYVIMPYVMLTGLAIALSAFG